MKTTITFWLLFFFLSCDLNSATEIEIIRTTNFSESQRQRIDMIASNLERVINSEHFMNQVLAHKFNGVTSYSESNGDSNLQIYLKIMSGYEKLDPNTDNKWKLNLFLKWLFSQSTLAYTYFNSPEIYINSRYFNRGSDASIAGTICHEYMHKLGYEHSKKNTSTRPFTVPYGVGDICESIYVNMIGHNYAAQESCGMICSIRRLLSGYFE